MSDISQGDGWWQASDGKWYPPEQSPAQSPSSQPTPAPRLDVGAALSYGWSKFVENLSSMIVIVLIFFGVQIGFQFISNILRFSIDSFFLSLFLGFGLMAVGLFVGFLVEAGIIRAALAVTRGDKPDPALMFSTERLAPFAIASILVALLSFVGFFFCCVGFLVVRLFLLFYGFYVLDKDVAPADSLKKSYDLVSKNAGDVVIFAIVIVLINLFTCGLAIGVTEIAVGYAYKQLNGEPVAA
jgi:hypothetical protein